MNEKQITNQKPYLELSEITKTFGHTHALNGMNLKIVPGEIIGVVGPNGAGKSTLMKVITGVYPPTSGTIIFNETEEAGAGYHAAEAKKRGIACAYQELSLCSNLNTYENFMINHMDHTFLGKRGWRKKAARDTKTYLDTVFPNNNIDIKAPVSGLALPQRQMIEIAKAMSNQNLRVLILDEPTSSLNGERIQQLHDYMRKLCEKQVAIIYISHKLDEIDRICDRVSVMKGGQCVLESGIADISPQELVEVMGGKVSVSQKKAVDKSAEPNVLTVRDLNTDQLKHISMNIKKGEIIGISGLAGSGQKDLILEIFNAANGKKNSAISVTTKASYVSGDRNTEGLFPMWNIADNTLVSSLDQVSSKGFIDQKKSDALAQHWYDKLKFIANGTKDDISSLSGGNQQKALIARGIAAEAGIILLNDPTCGVDVETKQEIYRLMDEARGAGKTIILHSTEDLEMEQCDRIYIMHQGGIVAELTGEEISVKNIVTASFESFRKQKDELQKQDDAPEAKQMSLPRRLLHNRAALPIITLAAILIINASLNPRIVSYTGLTMLFSSAIPLVFIALSQMFLVVSGGIDMGNGMAVGLLNVIVAFTVVNNPALGAGFLVLFVLAYGAMGALIYSTRIPAIVVTLGASFIWLGLGLIVSPTPGGTSPEWLTAFFKFKFPLIPMPIVIAALAAFGTWWILRRSKYGMIINGNGNNPTAIARAGWSRMAAVIATYMIAGALLVCAGMSVTVISIGGDVNSTATYQMLSIATIILGGCEFKGGISSPVGVTFGALAISSISVLLTFLSVDSNLQSAVTGLILIGALAIKLASHRKEA